MTYRIDMHIHTEQSMDSRTLLSVIAKNLVRRGLNCAVVTDHDTFGIDTVTVIGGVTFIPGVEFTTDRGHLLGAFMSGFEKPSYNGKKCGFAEAANIIHKYGGICILAHPYEYTSRNVEEISEGIRASRKYLDCIEGFNCRAVNKRHNANELARDIASELSLPMTCGSDGHMPSEYGMAYLEAECESADGIRDEILAGRVKLYGGCVNRMNMAKSQWIKRRKRKDGLRKKVTAILYFGVCALREAGAFFRGENKKCQRL